MDIRDIALAVVAVAAMVCMTFIEYIALVTGEDGAYIAPYMTALGMMVGAVGGYLYGRRSGDISAGEMVRAVRPR